MSYRTPEYLEGLVRELVKNPSETPWLEFKHNNAAPQDVGEYLSALANAAALGDKANAYLLWGVGGMCHIGRPQELENDRLLMVCLTVV